MPEVKAAFAKIAVLPVGGSTADTEKFINAERGKWHDVVKSANIAME